jgi:glycosyltransferase involved in cell wall biosynthesis
VAKPLKITYLFESTTLWGGNKVALEQAEALSDEGYHVSIVSKDSGPSWYPLKLPVIAASTLDAETIPESDIIVGTYWPTVRAAYESKRGLAVHLCQGYEGGNKELLSQKAAIDEVYSYKIPKLTVSPHLDRFLKERFQADTYYIGHMLNREIFHPLKGRSDEKGLNPFKILVVGPFEADVKNIATALKGISLARKRLDVVIKLIRISQFPLSPEEKGIMEPDEYHAHVPYPGMGEFYRNADLLISVSKEAEGFGLPALEAMGCGVPTILSRISSYTSFDRSLDYALFVEPPDYESLAESIVVLFNDRPLRERLIQRGLTIAEKFTKEGVVARLKAAFETIRKQQKLPDS